MADTQDMKNAPDIKSAEGKASGSSFYAAMRILPKAERDAMFAIYAFCREVDDIADDGPGTPDERREALALWRADIEALYRGSVVPATAILVGPVSRFGLKKEDFLAVIDGMEMDITDDIGGVGIKAPSLATLDLYCDRVASAVGRLSVRIFGMEEQLGILLAHHLGRALQLTNILRDIDEDAAINRLYLPLEALVKAEIPVEGSIIEIIENPNINKTCHHLAHVAAEHYRQADLIFRMNPAGRLLPARVMRRAYGHFLDSMHKQGWTAPRQRLRLSKAKLILMALREGLFR